MAITVGQLKAMLADIPDSAVIYMSSDDEGNSYRATSGIEYSDDDKANHYVDYDGEATILRREDLEYMEISKRKWGKPVAVVY